MKISLFLDQPPPSNTVAENANVHAGETVRIEVRNSGAAFYVTANGDEFLPFHTFGGTRDRDSCCRDTIQSTLKQNL